MNNSAVNTKAAPETRIVVNPALPTVEIIREFDASPELVFRAHVDGVGGAR